MPAVTVPLTGDELLAAVTEAMIALHERYHHRRPVTAKTLLLDDELLACVLGGVCTDVEKTMIELQHTAIVKQTRSTFQTATRHKFIGAIERLPGHSQWPGQDSNLRATDYESQLLPACAVFPGA